MRKAERIVSLSLAAVMAFGLTACSGQKEEKPDETKAPFVPEVVGVYEAEDGSCTGNVKAESEQQGYSGTGYAAGFKADDDECTITINIKDAGFYDLVFTTGSAGAYKENYVSVDGEAYGNLVTETDGFEDSAISHVYMEPGEHKVTVTKYWGWIYLDKLTVQTSEPVDESIYKVSKELVNPNATDNAKRLMSYLVDNYGKNVLSGQYCDTGEFGKEFKVISDVTGKKPAVIGLDMIEYSPSRVENGSSSKAVEFAEQFWKDGGIVTFCWHWNAPSKYIRGEWYKGFSSDSVTIDIEKIMNGEDQEGYDLLMEDIDAIAQQLLKLQDAGVPILWRPLHEASGGWFWWGKKGAEPYKELYRLLYDKLTNEYKINNLIWVWNGQDPEWYPGDEYVDIIGEDIYPGEQVYTSQINKYLDAVKYTDTPKMVVLSENGCVPDPDLLKRDGAMWGFWCTWGGEFVAQSSAFYKYSDTYTDAESLKKFYDNEIVITLDELPDLTQYSIK